MSGENTNNTYTNVSDLPTMSENNTYTNVSDLPTMSELSSPAYVPVEDANKDGKKVDLTTIMPGTLDTTSDTAQTTKSAESLSGSVKLHKVSKTGSYNDLLYRPKLNTTTTTSQPTKQDETVSGTIYLHAVSKTGSFNDIVNKPILDTRSASERTPAQETINGTIYLHSVAKTGKIESLSTSKGTWREGPYTISADTHGRISLTQANPQNYMHDGTYTSNYDFCDGTADDLYDIPDYGVTLAYIWKPGKDSRWNCLELEEYYATYGGDDVIWDNEDIETIRIIIPVSGTYPDTIPEGYLKILPVTPSAESKMPTSVNIAISFNENFGKNPKYDSSFEDDNTPLTCVSGPSVIDTTKAGFIKVYDRYYEIVQF